MNTKHLPAVIAALFACVLFYVTLKPGPADSGIRGDGQGRITSEIQARGDQPTALAKVNAAGIRAYDDPPPVVEPEPEPVHVTGIRWARRDIDERARSAVTRRQERVRHYIAQVDGTVELESEMLYGIKAMALTTYAVETIFDATGRAVTVELGKYDAEGKKIWVVQDTPDFPHHSIWSDGARYVIPIGEFPAYDRIQELLKEYPTGIPIGEIPFEEVIALGHVALSYRLQ